MGWEKPFSKRLESLMGETPGIVIFFTALVFAVGEFWLGWEKGMAAAVFVFAVSCGAIHLVRSWKAEKPSE